MPLRNRCSTTELRWHSIVGFTEHYTKHRMVTLDVKRFLFEVRPPMMWQNLIF
ncbi:hypothetical protein ACFLTJ_02615 [Chloroflexota bacterium]